MPNQHTPFVSRVLLAQMQLELEKKREHDVDVLKQKLFAVSQSQEEAEARSAALKEEQKKLLEDMRYKLGNTYWCYMYHEHLFSYWCNVSNAVFVFLVVYNVLLRVVLCICNCVLHPRQNLSRLST